MGWQIRTHLQGPIKVSPLSTTAVDELNLRNYSRGRHGSLLSAAPVGVNAAIPVAVTGRTPENRLFLSMRCIGIRGATIPLFIRSQSRSGIAKWLKILLQIQIEGRNHNTSIGVTIPLFTGSEIGS